ncbi:hypothetical protein [Streptoalloteichus hindustanus]|nr:hypothetical protein [Streptoalloteichus hindustanus]
MIARTRDPGAAEHDRATSSTGITGRTGGSAASPDAQETTASPTTTRRL